MRRILGIAVLSWATYRLAVAIAEGGISGGVETFVGKWWPLAIVLVGIVAGAKALVPAGKLYGPLVVLATGVVALGFTTGTLTDPATGPTLIALAALPIGWYLASADTAPTVVIDGWPRIRAIAANRRVHLCAQPLKHAVATVALGSLILDARTSATLGLSEIPWTTRADGHGARLDATVVGGRLEIRVPESWIVIVDEAKPGGRVERHVPAVPDDEARGRIQISALVLGGRLVIRT